MDIFGVGIGEILVILVIAMAAVGPEKMVKFAGDLGRYLRKFRAISSEVTKEFHEAFTLEMEDEEGTDAGEKETSTQSPASKAPVTTSRTIAPPIVPKPKVTPSVAPPAADSQPEVASAAGEQEPAPAASEPEPESEPAEAPPAEPEPVGDLSDILGGAFVDPLANEDESEAEGGGVEAEPKVSTGVAKAAEVTQPAPPSPEPREAAEEPPQEVAETAAPAPMPPEETRPESQTADASVEDDTSNDTDAGIEIEDSGLMAPIPTFGFDGDDGSGGERQRETE